MKPKFKKQTKVSFFGKEFMFHDKKYADPKVNQIRMVVKKKKPFW
jgi:hypothetical protein